MSDIPARTVVADKEEILPELVLGLGEAKIGTLPKDKPQGKLPDEWNQAYVSAVDSSI